MINTLIYNTVKFVGTSESTFGQLKFIGNNLIIPYFNVYITSVNNNVMKNEVGKRIKICYLLFENVSSVVWDYEMSRKQDRNKTDCFGGTCVFNNEFYEFWIEYESGKLIIDSQFELSTKSLELNEPELIKLLNGPLPTEVLNLIMGTT